MATWEQKDDGYWYNPFGNARYRANPYTTFSSLSGENEAVTNYAPLIGSLQDLDPITGEWKSFAGIPHQEEFNYQLRARELPDWQQALNDLKAGTADKWDQALMAVPGAWGQANMREDLSQFSPLGGTEEDRRNTFLMQTGADKMFDLGFTPEQRQIAEAQIASSTPQAQAARDTSDGLGDLANLAMLAAAIYSGGAALGAWGGAGAAGTGMTAAEAASAFGWSDAATAGLSGAFDGFGAGALGSLGADAGMAAMFDGLTSGQIAALAEQGAGLGAGGAGMFDIFGGVGSDAIVDQQLAQALEGNLAGGLTDIGGLTSDQWAQWAGNAASSGVPWNTIQNVGKALFGGGGQGGQSGTGWLGGLFGPAVTGLGSYLQGKTATDAAQTAANAQLEAARIAADAAKFRPVGVTTRFGQSNFQKDAQGNVIGAGYNLSPDVKAQQDALMAASNGMLGQFTGAQAATAPMGQAAQTMFGLGQGYLGANPQEMAKKFMQDQQALLATGRERDLANLQNRLLAQGRLGLATGGTSTGMGAANPEMEALFNAQRQQDLKLAADATKGGMDYAKFGAGMVGTGGDMLKGMYGAQTAAFDPHSTALGGATKIEGLGQQALDTGVNLGRQTSNAGAGQLLAQGMNNAANTMLPANSYSPWGSMLSGLGTQLQGYKFDPFSRRAL